ncbi:hypothetical protein ACLGGT_21555 [Roseovarius sp. MS2]|uniref:hypothetical protein n=1 Tax=Roseovarius sp. MS2 TaxID=3390728 RepID=UPI003EDBF36A
MRGLDRRLGLRQLFQQHQARGGGKRLRDEGVFLQEGCFGLVDMAGARLYSIKLLLE